MKKVKLNIQIIGLDGKPMEGVTLGQVVADRLANAVNGDPLKFMAWAQKLHDNKELELDPSDIETFKAFINNAQNMTILLKARILEVLI